MGRVEEWLKSLGLGEYAQRFADNDIDFSLLGELSDKDLVELGIASLGHRKRLLRAIAELQPSELSAAMTQVTLKSPAQPPPQTTPETAGERRYLTIMFCDLVGSTGIAAGLDAEEWRDIVGGYLDAASAAVTEMSGHVAKKLGDGVMALFGYPVAFENDTERAARAALAIQSALGEINRKNAAAGKPMLSARIGLEAGSVVVDPTGEIFGDAPNVAARVQALAEPGSVLVTSRVQRHVAGLFVVEDRGSHKLKGVSEPQTLFRLVRASGGGRRSGQRNLTPIVGREEEIAVLMRRWERARLGDGQLVMIVGEPGLGKSRLIEELHARLRDMPHTWVELGCSQLLQNTPLHPIAEWGRQRFGGGEAPADRRLVDLENTLAQVKLDPAENAPLLAPLLDIQLPQKHAPVLAPEELRRRQLAALINWFLAGAKVQSAVLIVEDLHWADPTTLDFLRAVAERGSQAPLFVVGTARPEFRPPWGMRSHHGVISLAPLDPGQVRVMVEELSARHALPGDVIEDVAARTGGVPLFVEELTRLLLESGAETSAHAIPPTLQQSLAARLDRLGLAREVAQIGAVLGRSFSYGLLQAVADLDETGLQASLERLADADLLFVEGAPPQATYRFKHALIQDAAYESLLKSRRQPLHRRAAEVLRDSASAEPEAIAHHFTEAGLDDLAIEWWGKAGDQALRRSAFQEAISHLGKAISMADKVGDAATARRGGGEAAASSQRVKLQTDFGQAVMWSKGFAADEAKAAFARASELLAKTGDFSERFATAHGQWTSAFVRGDFKAARELASTFLREAKDAGYAMELGVASRGLALISRFSGDLVEARTHCERALEAQDPERDQEMRERFGDDTGVTAASALAAISWELGDVERARELIDSASRRAAELGHAPSMVHPLLWRTHLELMRGDPTAALSSAEALAALGREHGMTYWRVIAELYAAYARGRLYDAAAGAAEFRRALRDLADTGAANGLSFFTALLAELEVETLGVDSALARIDEALALTLRTDNRMSLSFINRLRGEILLKRNETRPAEEAFQSALAVSQEQGARSFGLQAALALAKLYRSTGRPADAYSVLAPAFEGFTPTRELPEIAEAAALLTQLEDTDKVKAEAARGAQRLQLHVAYGNALIATRGYGAPETTEAFARARAVSFDADASERLSVDYGLWVGSYLRGELPSMRAHANAFLGDIGAHPDAPEASVAYRAAGITHWFAGEYAEASTQLERALALFQPGRDDDLAFRFGHDPGVGAMLYLAIAAWPRGEISRSLSLVEHAGERIASVTHVGTQAYGAMHAAMFELMRGDIARVASSATELARLANDHELALWRAFGVFLQGWLCAQRGDFVGGIQDMRRGVDLLRDQNAVIFDALLKIALAETEAAGDDPDRALATLDSALQNSDQIGHRSFDAELHRARGEILAGRRPVDAVASEAAFRTAIEIASRQGTRSFGLRAALALAKLYRSTARPVDAHAVLAPVLQGFSPISEMAEIAEAYELLAVLTNTEEVKAEASRDRLRQHLQVAYGNALIAVRGFGAPETTEAFARARESASREKDSPERLAADFGLWAGAYTRGELPSMRAYAKALFKDVEATPEAPEAGVAHRIQGITHWFAGEYREARERLERALALFQPGRDDDMALRFGPDAGVSSMAYLAFACWPLGEVDRAISLIDRMKTRMAGLEHANTLALGKMYAAQFALMCGGQGRLTENASELARIAREHDLAQSRAFGTFFEGLATAESDLLGGLEGMRRGAKSLHEQNIRVFDGLVKIALAGSEASAGYSERAVAILDEALATAERLDYRAFEAELHRVRGELLFRRNSGNLKLAEEAFQTAIAVAKHQAARSFELRAALSLAKVYQSTGRSVDAHAVLAPALQGFSPILEMAEIAEAQTMLTKLVDTDEVKAAMASRKRRLRLQMQYRGALAWSRGVAAEETKAAAARAEQLVAEVNDPAARFGAYELQFLPSLLGGRLASAGSIAETYLSEAKNAGALRDTAVAGMMVGVVRMYQGAFADARAHLVGALDIYDHGLGKEIDLASEQDWGAFGSSLLALIYWQLGEVERAQEMIEQARSRADKSQDVFTSATMYSFTPMLEAFRCNAHATLREAETLTEISSRIGIPLFSAVAKTNRGWARARLGDREAGLEELRQGLAEYAEQKALLDGPFGRGLLAELEAEGPSADRALAHIDEALALAQQTGEHWTDALLHRIRGDILLKADPENPARAEDAYLAAIAVAREQGARSFGLQAALKLAKLYQSTARPVEAHDALAPALEGFSPTPEMPEIAEAQALLAALAESDQVKAAVAQRERRLHLQTAYGQAMMWSKGFGAEEARAAFTRSQELATAVDNAAERFDAYYGLWVGSLVRGELRLARETAETFLHETEKEERTTEAAAARRCLGLACLFQGDLAVARAHFEQALRIFDPERDREAKFRFSTDTGASATVYLALANWQLGEAGRARKLREDAIARAVESTHAPTLANAYWQKALFDAVRDDAEAARRDAEIVVELSRQHGLALYMAWGTLPLCWANARLGDLETGVTELGKALAAYTDQGNRMYVPFFQGVLAELEAEGPSADRALAHIDEALALAQQTGEHWTDALLHRIRGDILLKADPENPARAEDAYLAAIAVAREQGARSFGLQAALKLAKLYQSTARPVEAHDALAPALEGFSPTPEMPEIAQAQALMEELARTEKIKTDADSGSNRQRSDETLRPPRASDG